MVITHTLSAQEEKIETDRPDQTESPYTVPKNYFQFEWGINHETDKVNNIKTHNFVHPTGLYKYGVNDHFELRVIVQPYTQTVYGNPKTHSVLVDPVFIGFKTTIAEEKGWLPKTSFIAHISVPPFASKTFRQNQPAPIFRFTMQNSLSKTFSLGYNLGMEWDGENPAPAYIYTLAPGFTINEKWAGYAELYGFIRKNNVPEHAIDGGIYYYPNKNMKFDISAGYGLTKAALDFYVALGYSIRFKL